MRMLPSFGCCLVVVTLWSGTPRAAAELTEEIESLLAAKQFDQATQRVQQVAGNQDELFGKIALAQAASGASQEAKQTLRHIRDVGSLQAATQQIAGGAAGGGTGADFDSLINLITSTVEPNSWDDVGGPGSIQPFPGGIDVDAQGVLRRIPSQEITGLLRQRNLSQEAAPQDDPRRPSALRMVSLPRLVRELQLLATFGEPATDAMRHLAGLRRVDYVFVYPETGDFVIAGPAGGWTTDGQGRIVGEEQQPVLLLEDLVALVKNADSSAGRFGCSISPKPANLAQTKAFLDRPTGPLKPSQTPRWVEAIRDRLGRQNITIHGVDPDSHVARVLVEADYHMKLVGMGLEPSVAGVPSYLDSVDAHNLPGAVDVLRWWFTLRPEAVVRDETGTAYQFLEQTVRLQSENEHLGDRGQRVQTGRSSALNQQFARRFTRHFDRLSAKYPIYRQLENLFRLALVAALLQDEAIQEKLAWQPDWLASRVRLSKGQVPREVDSIINHRVVNRRHVLVGVSGGISVNTFVSLKQLPVVSDTKAIQTRRRLWEPMLPRHSERWWWD